MIKTIKFTEQQLKDCEDFSNSVDTGFYANRNQRNIDKKKRDTKIGKLGEMATYEFLKDRFADLTPPDLKIYTARQKSWDYDLKADGINIHVKSQDIEQGKRYGTSWVFEKTDKHIFQQYNTNDYVVLVSVDLFNGEATINSILPITTLHQKSLFKPPVLVDRLPTKLVIYYQDVQSLPNSLA